MTAYLDASVILPTLVVEQTSARATAFITTAVERLVVSEFAAAEVVSAISRLVRTRILERENALARLAQFDLWRVGATIEIDIRASDFQLTNEFVRRFDLMLRAPDALHIALCRRAGCSLVTLDRRLAAAARELGVPVQLLA